MWGSIKVGAKLSNIFTWWLAQGPTPTRSEKYDGYEGCKPRCHQCGRPMPQPFEMLQSDPPHGPPEAPSPKPSTGGRLSPLVDHLGKVV